MKLLASEGSCKTACREGAGAAPGAEGLCWPQQACNSSAWAVLQQLLCKQGKSKEQASAGNAPQPAGHHRQDGLTLATVEKWWVMSVCRMASMMIFLQADQDCGHQVLQPSAPSCGALCRAAAVACSTMHTAGQGICYTSGLRTAHCMRFSP